MEVTDWPPHLHVQVSAWDHRVHAFSELGGVWSEALCRHTCVTEHMRAPSRDDPTCLGCLEVLASEPWRLHAPE